MDVTTYRLLTGNTWIYGDLNVFIRKCSSAVTGNNNIGDSGDQLTSGYNVLLVSAKYTGNNSIGLGVPADRMRERSTIK